MANKPKPTVFTLELNQKCAVGVTLSDGTRIPTQEAKVARIDEKSAILELQGGGQVTILV